MHIGSYKIRLSQANDHSISVDRAIYATYIVAKYLGTATIKISAEFYKTTFLYDIIFAKEDSSTSDDQVEKLARGFNIPYKYCIGSMIYLLSTREDFSFAVHKLARFLSNTLLRYIRYNNILG